jgi:hypothetical protein
LEKSVESPVTPAHVSVQAQVKERIQVPSKQPSEKSVSKGGFDFFSDDDDSDDNIDIFAKKQPVQRKSSNFSVASKVKMVPKVLESSSDEEVKMNDPIHKKEVSVGNEIQVEHVLENQSKHRSSLPLSKEGDSILVPPFPVKKTMIQNKIIPEKSTSSALFADDSDSDEDLFSRKTSSGRLVLSSQEDPTQVTDRRASATLNVLTSSPEDRLEEGKATSVDRVSISPPVEVQLRKKAASSDSDSSQEAKKMDRKSIASRLENTIFGSTPKKKPVGGISIFKDVAPKTSVTEKQEVEPSTNQEKDEEWPQNEQVKVSSPIPEVTKGIFMSRTSSSSSSASTSKIEVEKVETPQLLSSAALKSRAKIPVTRKRPSRGVRKPEVFSDLVEKPMVVPNNDLLSDQEYQTLKKAAPIKSIESRELSADVKPIDVKEESTARTLSTAHEVKAMPQVNPVVAKVTKASIFSDSEDDDDIFGPKEVKKMETSTLKTIAPKTSLFPDSSDDDSSLKTKKSNGAPSNQKEDSAAKSKVTKSSTQDVKQREDPVKKNKSSKKLFDDDSDDDEGELSHIHDQFLMSLSQQISSLRSPSHKEGNMNHVLSYTSRFFISIFLKNKPLQRLSI